MQQMLRHLDCAWEIRGTRQICGFFIVEGESDGTLPKEWEAATRQLIEDWTLKRSLPHRTNAERGAIADAFLGATTWQKVCRSLDVPWSWLPDEVLEGVS